MRIDFYRIMYIAKNWNMVGSICSPWTSEDFYKDLSARYILVIGQFIVVFIQKDCDCNVTPSFLKAFQFQFLSVVNDFNSLTSTTENSIFKSKFWC